MRQSVFGWAMVFSGILAATGCTERAMPVMHSAPVSAGRTAEDKEKLIKPGTFGATTRPAAADVRRRFFDFWNEQVIREDAVVSTVFMGDSITELWDLPVYFQPRGGIIQNRGISGDLAAHMAKRFDADVVQLRPRNVIILAGTNDISRMIEAGKSDDEIVSNVSDSILSMMKSAKAAGIKTLVCSILPTNSDCHNHPRRGQLAARVNEKVKTACTESGATYVDYASQMVDANGDLRKDLARDGLHPHYGGYEIMARVLKAAARQQGLQL